MNFGYILFFSLLGGIGALTGAGILLLFPRLHERLRNILLSYAIGTLLGATFIGLLPHAMTHASVDRVLQTVLAGLVVFFILEKVLKLPHLHAQSNSLVQGEGNPKKVIASAPLILIGDTLHNFVDGVLIATAFSVSVPLGVSTSLAVIAHEVPQELGDFVILIESGMRRWKAYWINFISALGTLVGALCTVWLGADVEQYVPYILAVSAASFIHVATVDLSPILHQGGSFRSALRQTIGFLFGIATIWAIH